MTRRLKENFAGLLTDLDVASMRGASMALEVELANQAGDLAADLRSLDEKTDGVPVHVFESFWFFGSPEYLGACVNTDGQPGAYDPAVIATSALAIGLGDAEGIGKIRQLVDIIAAGQGADPDWRIQTEDWAQFAGKQFAAPLDELVALWDGDRDCVYQAIALATWWIDLTALWAISERASG